MGLYTGVRHIQDVEVYIGVELYKCGGERLRYRQEMEYAKCVERVGVYTWVEYSPVV